jgi:hypothetical protein
MWALAFANQLPNSSRKTAANADFSFLDKIIIESIFSLSRLVVPHGS